LSECQRPLAMNLFGLQRTITQSLNDSVTQWLDDPISK
jgi:hypothetical protein